MVTLHDFLILYIISVQDLPRCIVTCRKRVGWRTRNLGDDQRATDALPGRRGRRRSHGIPFGLHARYSSDPFEPLLSMSWPRRQSAQGTPAAGSADQCVEGV